MNKLILILGILMGLIGLLLVTVMKLPGEDLRVWVMEVGQGDAILLESPVGERILIDGGPDSKVMERLGEILPFYVDELDLVVLSHPHADHLNGLLEVLKRYQVKAVLMTGAKYNFGGYDEFYRLLGEKKIKVYWALGSEDFRLGKMGIDVIYPETSLQGLSFNNINNSSIVLRVIYGQERLFFSGDLEMEKEAELVKKTTSMDKEVTFEAGEEKRGLNLGADWMKAAHHGSKTSNTEDFLKLIGAKEVVISCGVDNSFKHPAASTVERFGKMGMKVGRTDIEGTVRVLVDGKGKSL